MEAARSVDIAVLGGGLAGNLIARQLRRQLPGLSLALFERNTESSFKVGESTVELACHYFLRRLGLSTYLYQHHLPKNGLRFFFDTPDKQASWFDMTEIGSRNLLRLPTFQIDRARLETDLLRMNQDLGADIHLGARVHDLALAPDTPGPHAFTVTEDERATRWTARWLIDATGRASLVARDQGLRLPLPELKISSVWGRFRGFADPDDLGPPAWRARVHHTARFLSTNHFCYPGYWLWFIPLGRDVMSVGWVGEQHLFDDAWRKTDGFLALLRQHRAPWHFLRNGDTELLDLFAYKHLAYNTTRFFRGERRWFLLGESAAFTDPFYSPGSDFIALEADFITDMIARDHAGEPRAQIAERSDTYDAFMHFRLAANLLLYRDLYSLFGSFELMKLKWDFDIACYYNLWTAPYLHDQHLDLRYLTHELRRKDFVLQALSNFTHFFKRIEAHVRERGAYFRRNLGDYVSHLEHVDFLDDIFAPRPRKQVLRTTEAIFNNTRRRGLQLLHDLGVAPLPAGNNLPLYEFMVPETLA